MANICDNTLYACSENVEDIELLYEFIKENFSCSDLDIDYEDFDSSREAYLNAYFDSKWNFPQSKLEEVTNKLKDKNAMYIRCLSVEYGCDYVSYNKFVDGEWINIV
jgi:hypothetical protein